MFIIIILGFPNILFFFPFLKDSYINPTPFPTFLTHFPFTFYTLMSNTFFCFVFIFIKCTSFVTSIETLFSYFDLHNF